VSCGKHRRCRFMLRREFWMAVLVDGLWRFRKKSTLGRSGL
jgi:hypothetical protein